MSVEKFNFNPSYGIKHVVVVDLHASERVPIWCEFERFSPLRLLRLFVQLLLLEAHHSTLIQPSHVDLIMTDPHLDIGSSLSFFLHPIFYPFSHPHLYTHIHIQPLVEQPLCLPPPLLLPHHPFNLPTSGYLEIHPSFQPRRWSYPINMSCPISTSVPAADGPLPPLINSYVPRSQSAQKFADIRQASVGSGYHPIAPSSPLCTSF